MRPIILVTLLAGILLIGFVSLSTPVAAQEVQLEGGDSKQDATVIGPGQEIKIALGDSNDNNWYKLPVSDPGTVATIKFGEDWDYHIDELQIGNKRLNGEYNDFNAGKEYRYVVTETAVYYNFDSDGDDLNGKTFEITTKDPDRNIFQVDSLTVLPTTKLSPNQEVTVQADILYNRQSTFNPESASVTMLIGDEEIATETVTGNPGGTASIQFEETIPNLNGSQNLTVHVNPGWANQGGNEKTETISVKKRDLDGDGLQRTREIELGTDPADPDTDGDGINDGRELELGTDPLESDTDGDGLDDGAEIENGADPLVKDSDSDKIDDGKEIEIGTDPSSKDSDGDGILDDREIDLGTDPTKADTDGDGISDSEEIEAGSDPTDRADRGGSPGSMIFTASETASVTNGTFTVEYTVGVKGEKRINGTSVELKNPEDWSVVETSGKGEFSEANQEWLLVSVGPEENDTISATIEPTSQMEGTKTLEAVAQDSTGRLATATTTINFDATNVPQAIDQNNNNKLELVEIQRAIRLWSENEPVPNTDGSQMDLNTLQDLINIWSNNGSI